MDRPFLYEMACAYVNDHKLSREKIEECNQELISLMEELRLLDESTYNYLHSLNRLQQQQIIYTYLQEHRSQLINDFKDVIEEISGDELVTEDAGIVAVGAITAIATAIASLVPSTVVRKYVSKAVTTLDTIARGAYDLLSETLGAKRSRVIDAILYNRLKSCSQKCGVRDTRDLGKFAPSALMGGKFADEKTREKVKCLVNCYLWYHINTIVLLASEYRKCVQSTTGQNIHIGNITFLQQHPLDNECNVYYKTLKDYVSSFEEAIDVLYEHDDKSKSYWFRNLNQKLNAVEKNPNNIHRTTPEESKPKKENIAVLDRR